LELAERQTITATLEAYVLASPVEGLLRLLDARGVEVAFNHDNGRTLDPEITYTAPRAGAYFLQAFGFNYPADSNIRFIGNDKLEAPGEISGCIESPEDEDIFQFTAKKGDKLVLKVESTALGFPLDARLGIRNAKQEEVAKADDSATTDPVLDWSPGDDGTFFAAVRNVLNRGGTNYRYRLSIQKPAPALKATVGDHAFTVAAGKTNKVSVTLKQLHGFDGKVSLKVEGLPPGVSAEAGEKDVSLMAAPDAKPFSGPIRIIASDSKTTYPAAHELVSAGENNGVPNGYSRLLIDAIDDLWLTVTAAK
jgi:hypothetical protein